MTILETTNNAIKPVRLKGWGFTRKKKPTLIEKDGYYHKKSETLWYAHKESYDKGFKEGQEQERKRCYKEELDLLKEIKDMYEKATDWIGCSTGEHATEKENEVLAKCLAYRDKIDKRIQQIEDTK